MPSPLIVKHADGLTPVVQVLGAVLGRRTLADGLRPDWVLVQSRPMAQWLTLELARSLGACAGVEWLLPAAFIGRTFTATGLAAPLAADPWRREALAWRILARLPDLVATPGGAYAARGGLQAWQLANRVADRFDTWQLTRPDWLAHWEAGRQPPAWRRIHTLPGSVACGETWPPMTGPAKRAGHACRQLPQPCATAEPRACRAA